MTPKHLSIHESMEYLFATLSLCPRICNIVDDCMKKESDGLAHTTTLYAFEKPKDYSRTIFFIDVYICGSAKRLRMLPMLQDESCHY